MISNRDSSLHSEQTLCRFVIRTTDLKDPVVSSFVLTFFPITKLVVLLKQSVISFLFKPDVSSAINPLQWDVRLECENRIQKSLKALFISCTAWHDRIYF